VSKKSSPVTIEPTKHVNGQTQFAMLFVSESVKHKPALIKVPI